MEYGDSEQAAAVASRTREFVDEVVIPVERDVLGDGPVSDDQIAALREEAREWDVYAPQVDEEYGGMGLDFRDMLPVFEQAGRSLLAMAAMRVAAPDEGNMHLLELVGTDEQKDRWLGPLAAGELRSGFSMTEPLQGAGSDPKMIQTTAEKDGDEWVIDGHKWWTTQGTEADLLIVFARTDQDAHPYEGCSTFLVPADADGVEVLRDIPHVGGGVAGVSHAEIRYDSVRVPEENLLGDLHEGFTNVQLRLGPARLTHCMRYSGMGQRALDVAKAYATERRAFDGPLSEKQDLRYRVADAETRLHAVRTMVRHAADRIAAGEQARVPVSMCKVFAANTVQEAIDLAVQICGGNGVGKDLPLADFYENVRQFRVIDGADEVHKRVIARDAFDDVDAWELDAVTRFGDPVTER
ncbi:acyl-CoA dehydrogenase family protein [Halobacterium yunchengense]|uniref:acyl-CoA dehydrogenase family protein n=1 Tax=Halobacterium yunchengense TaxID=3108497 RepID=UPI003009108B